MRHSQIRAGVLAFLALFSAACRAHMPAPSVQTIAHGCADDTVLDVLHHDVELSLQLDPRALRGRGELRLRTRRATDTLVLSARLHVTEVATAGSPLVFHQEEGRLCAALPQPLPAGAELRLQLAWEVPTDGATPRFAGEQVWAGYHTAAWLPTRQDPAQRATLALRIDAPAELKVVASGRALAQEAAAKGRTRHSFVVDRPTPPFLYAFAAGRFREVRLAEAGLQLRALAPLDADADGALAATAQALRFLSEKLAVRLPLPEYTQVFVSGDAAQEAVGMALLSASFLADLVKDPMEDWIFAHELSHQWFAWLLPCADFADFWLNEGFATFLVAAIKEQRWGRPAYERELRLWRERSAKVHRQGRDLPLSQTAPGAARSRPPDESQLPPRGVTYARGALALHRLRSELGEELFWKGIRSYVEQNAGRSVRSEDLRHAMELASGVDLRAFFARWIYAPAADI